MQRWRRRMHMWQITEQWHARRVAKANLPCKDLHARLCMGVAELWTLLRGQGVPHLWSASEGAHAHLVKEVEGKTVAIDLSAWIIQATCQPNLAEAFSDPDSQALIVTFNRVRKGHGQLS